jgi:hypothetical protein
MRDSLAIFSPQCVGSDDARSSILTSQILAASTLHAVSSGSEGERVVVDPGTSAKSVSHGQRSDG